MAGATSYGHLSEAWRTREEELTESGYSRSEAHKQIASEYEVSVSTVYRWLTPNYLEKSRSHSRSTRWQGRRRAYHRLVRHLDTHVPAVFRSDDTLEIEVLLDRLRRRTRYRLGPETFRRHLQRYTEQGRDIGIDEVEPGVYRRRR